MMKVKNGLIFTLTVLLLTTLAPKEASARCSNEWFGCVSFMQPCYTEIFTFGADFLWWKPCFDDIDFAGTRTTVTENNITRTDWDYKKICPEWRPGFRLNFDYPSLICWCNIGFNASYTYVDMDQKNSVHGSDNFYFVLQPGLAHQEIGSNPIHAKWDMRYQSWDSLFYFNYCCADSLYITPSIGVAGMLLDQALETEGQSWLENMQVVQALAVVKWKSHLSGIGIKSGLNFNYVYNHCLTFYGFTNGTILAARSHTTNRQRLYFTIGETDLVGVIKFKDHKCSRCVPGFHLGLGAKSTFRLCGFPLTGKIGYEFLQWYNIPKHRTFESGDYMEGMTRSAFTTRTFGFHGLFAGIDFIF
jgi:hypothetical protein